MTSIAEPAVGADRDLVLAVDDNEHNLQLLEEYLGTWGYDVVFARDGAEADRKSTRLNSSHRYTSYAGFCLQKKNHREPGFLALAHAVLLHARPQPSGRLRGHTATAIPRLVFFNDTATTEIYTLSLHDALPICIWIPVGPVHRGVYTVECRLFFWG